MKCHICGKPSTGQCQSCWRFYCGDHGDIVCEACQVQRGPFQSLVSGGTTVPLRLQAIPAEDAERMQKEMEEQMAQMPALKFKGEVLQRVIPVVQSLTHGATQVTLTSIEVYNDGFTLGYEIRRTDVDPDDPGSLMLPLDPEMHWRASDDTGQQFLGMNFGGGSTRRGWRTREVFAPSFSPAARLLTLEAEEVLWMAHGGMRSQAQPGPWRFEIPLT